MLVQCGHCGAPLDVTEKARLARCIYCRHTNRVASTRTIATQTPADFEPPKTWTPPAEAPASSAHVLHARPRRTASRAWLVVGVSTAAVGAAYLVFGGGVTLLAEWYQEPCLVDANGDAVLDPVGLMGRPGAERHPLAIVDGATGSRLWAGDEAYPIPTPVLCPTINVFIAEHDDFTVGIYPAADSDRMIRVSLPDKVRAWGADAQCVSIETRAEQRVGFSVATGHATPCAVAPATPNAPNMTSVGGTLGGTAPDGTSYALTAQQPGTPFLTLVVHGADGIERYTTRLRYAAANHDTLAMVLAGGVLVVYGSDPADRDYGVLIGIDAVTGRERYAIPQSSSWSGDLRSLLFNGRYVLAFWGFGLHAYDPATGARSWNVGGR